MKYSRLSQQKRNKLFQCFSKDLTATTTAVIVGINRNTVNTYFQEICHLIFDECIQENKREFGEFELDESYFGAKRVRGKRGRGAAGRHFRNTAPVFGLLKRNGKVFVTIVQNCSKSVLMPIIQGKILSGSTIHTDGWKAYDG